MTGLKALEFPALKAFLRGYLHQDFAAEHGSVRVAAAAFCREANSDERKQVAEELAKLIHAGRSLPLRTVRLFISRELGSGWEPKSASDLADLLSLIRAAR